MKGRFFMLLAVLSMLLFVLMVVLWVRSYWFIDVLCWDRGDSVQRNTRRTQCSLASQWGRLGFGWAEYSPSIEVKSWNVEDYFGNFNLAGVTRRHVPARRDWRADDSIWNRMGFRAERQTLKVGAGLKNRLDWSIFTVPSWFVTSLIATYPLV